MGQPRTLFHLRYFRLFDKFSSQQDSNSDCWSRRRGRWTLDHHLGPRSSFVNFSVIFGFRLVAVKHLFGAQSSKTQFIIFLECRDSSPGLFGEKSQLYLSAMPLPLKYKLCHCTIDWLQLCVKHQSRKLGVLGLAQAPDGGDVLVPFVSCSCLTS